MAHAEVDENPADASAADASGAGYSSSSTAHPSDSETTAAYNASIEKLKEFIKSLQTEQSMKTVIDSFDLNNTKIEVGDVNNFADQVIGVLKTLANETFDGGAAKFPYATDCITQIEAIKTALTPVVPSGGSGKKQSRQSRRSRSRSRNRSKSAHGRSKRH